MTPFDKMNQASFKSKGAMIAEELLAKIKSGEYASGGRLPSERLISEQMGVSRPSVREAISALQIVGIIKSRPGDGSYIADYQQNEGLAQQVKKIMEESDSPYEILQARMAMETGAIRLAIKEATDDDIDNIRKVWEERSRRGLAGDYQAYIHMGKELHLSIARATQNRIIIAVVDRLLNVTDQPLWQNMRRDYYESDPTRIGHMLAVHDRIVNAIQARDSREAILALEDDFNSVIKQLYNLDRDREESGRG